MYGIRLSPENVMIDTFVTIEFHMFGTVGLGLGVVVGLGLGLGNQVVASNNKINKKLLK